GEIIRDPIAIKEYLGKDFNDNNYEDEPSLPVYTPATPTLPFAAGAARPQPAGPRFDPAPFIEGLKTPDYVRAASELMRHGAASLPALLSALERQDVELRHQVVNVLQAILQRPVAFDPYAPAAQRKQQLADLRDLLSRKAS